MTKLHEGRWTSRLEAPFVLFLIGMRINKPWQSPSLGTRGRGDAANDPGARGQPAARLSRSGRLVRAHDPRSPVSALVRGVEAYAHARDKAHLPAWSAFNRAIGANGDVGVFHETYRIEPGAYENVYVNMPPLLLGRIGALVEARGRHEQRA